MLIRDKNVLGAEAAVLYMARHLIDDASIFGFPKSLKLIEDRKKGRVLGCDDVFGFIDFEPK